MNANIGSLWMIVASIGFALMGFFVKLSTQYFDYQEIVFWRMLISVVLLIIMVLLRQDSLRTQHLTAHLKRGVIGTIALILYFYLISYLPLATAVTLSYTSVIWFVVLAFFFLGQKVSRLVIATAVLGFIGVVFLLQPTFTSGQGLLTALGVLTGVLSAWAYIQVKQLAQLKEPEWKIVFYFSLVGVIITGVWSFYTGFHSLNAENIPYILAMGISALIAQVSMTKAYAVGNILFSSILSYLTIVFSFMLGYFFLHEQLTWPEILGISLIILSGILASFFGNKPTLNKILKFLRFK